MLRERAAAVAHEQGRVAVLSQQTRDLQRDLEAAQQAAQQAALAESHAKVWRRA